MTWMTVIPWLSTVAISVLTMTYQAEVENFTFGQWLVFFALSIFSMGLAVTPTTFISLIGGYFLGFKAIGPIILCYQLASLVGFFLARYADNQTIDWVKQRFPKSVPILDNVGRKPWSITFLARISPVLPFGLMNVVLAVSGVRLIPFFFGGLVGMLPRTLFFIWLGIQTPVLIDAIQTSEHLWWSIGLSMAGLFGLYKLLVAKR